MNPEIRENQFFFISFHKRSIRFKLGEYGGRYNNSMFKDLAKSMTSAHF